MKKLFFAIVLLATMSGAWAQTSCVPDLLNATAVVRDANGNPVTTQVDVKVEIYHGDPAAGGTLAFCEQQQNIQPNSFGEITIQFGAGNLLCVPPNTLLSAFQWQNCAQGATHFKMSWRVTGAPNYTDIVVNKFSTSPYAFVARTAENLSIPATTGQVLKYDGSKWAAGTDNTGSAGYTAGTGINISGNTITNSAPDQTVNIGGSNGIIVSGSYPTFQITSTALAPTGSIMAFAGTTAPAGWLLCDGLAINRNTYSALFGVIGNAYGSGDGVNTFNIPDLRGKFLRGVNGTQTAANGDPDVSTRTPNGAGLTNAPGSVQADVIKNHTHPFAHTNATVGINDLVSGGGTKLVFDPASYNINTNTQNNAGGSSETRPKNVYVNYIIKF